MYFRNIAIRKRKRLVVLKCSKSFKNANIIILNVIKMENYYRNK